MTSSARTSLPTLDGRRQVHVLWVCIGFPPKNDPDSLQVAKCFKYLLRHRDVAISAVTSANPTLWMTVDPALARYVEGCLQVIEIPIFEPRLLSIALLKFARPLVMVPDTRMTFQWQWRSVVRKLERKPDVIVSRSFPLSATVMAARLQRHFKVPWILHLTDPWVDSAIMAFQGPSAVYHRWMQARCFAAASRITLASPRMVSFYREHYPALAHKFELFPNIYDENDVAPPGAALAASDRLRVVYTGSLTGDRRISWFLDGLSKLRTDDPRAASRVDVLVAGDMDSANANAVRRAALGNVHCLGKVPFSEALRMQREADVLLVIDNPLPPTQSIFLPSKLLDYLATRNPILAITSPGSMTRDVVRASLGTCVDHGDDRGIVQFLRDKLRSLEAGRSVRGSAPGPDPVYGARYNADRLREMVHELASR